MIIYALCSISFSALDLLALDPPHVVGFGGVTVAGWVGVGAGAWYVLYFLWQA